MKLIVRYGVTTKPNYDMEKELSKLLKKHGWDWVGDGSFSDGAIHERDIEYERENK